MAMNLSKQLYKVSHPFDTSKDKMKNAMSGPVHWQVHNGLCDRISRYRTPMFYGSTEVFKKREVMVVRYTP